MKGEKISLCCIVGNVEGYIERWLDAFQPVADEVVLVRAVGSAVPDGTLALAEARGCRVSEYKNAPEHADWPHVDNFAAARNMAFGLGRHEWLMWADTDDVLPEGSAAAMRAMVEKAGDDVDLLSLPYEIPEQGITLWKERLVRRGVCVWRNAVHELMVPADPAREVRYVTAVTGAVQHAPRPEIDDRAAHNARNLRILQSVPEDRRTATEIFMLHKEHLGCGQRDEAVRYGLEFLQRPEAGVHERYEVLLMLGLIAEEGALSGQYLHMAYQCDPTRGEALAELVRLALGDGQPERALGYARALHALPPPSSSAWNVRWPVYSWIKHDLLAQALRMCGRREEAAAVLEALPVRISLLHATRGRAAQAVAARKLWMDRARKPAEVEHLFAVDEDDAEGLGLVELFGGQVVPAGGGCCAAWNAAAAVARGEILVQLSDDWVPPQDWDEELVRRFAGCEGPRVLEVSDGTRTDGLLCMAILNRAQLEAQGGTLFAPEFAAAGTGMFSDNWFTECARAAGVVVDARELVFEHLHPAFQKGEWDATYAAQNAPEKYAAGREVIERLRAAREGGPVLSILTPAIPERLEQVGALCAELGRQIAACGGRAEHLVLMDARGMTIGEKRDALLRTARGKYVAFCDDDDRVAGDYVARLVAACASGEPDVVTFRQRAVIEGQAGEIVFDLGCAENGQWQAGGSARRPPWHVCAWRREIALRGKYPASNYGEDWAWVRQVLPLAHKAAHVDAVLHEYHHSAATTAAPVPGADVIVLDGECVYEKVGKSMI